LSEAVSRVLTEARVSDPDSARRAALEACARTTDVIVDDDVQLTLWALYELHYGGFEDVDDAWEWHPFCVSTVAALEAAFEASLRRQTRDAVARLDSHEDFATGLFDYLSSANGRSVAAYLQRKADNRQMREFLISRTIYHLKEADPHTWAIPRLSGAPKVALVELQYDEYGAGRPERQHARLFEQTLRACGLSPTYGTYIDQIPASTLAVNNAMTMFGLNRRLRGACAGHLAAFEATSSLPAHRVSRGLRRLGFGTAAQEYYDEHVEADAVHEQIAARLICDGLLEKQPHLRKDVAFGAASCLCLDDLAGDQLLDAWERGESGLRSTAQRSGELVAR
jgi:hypothetical protein